MTGTQLFPLNIDELDNIILNQLNDDDLFEICSTDKLTKSLCQSVWQLRAKQNFPDLYNDYFPNVTDWQEWYFKAKYNGNKIYIVFVGGEFAGLFNNISLALQVAVKNSTRGLNTAEITANNFVEYMEKNIHKITTCHFVDTIINCYDLPLSLGYLQQNDTNIILYIGSGRKAIKKHGNNKRLNRLLFSYDDGNVRCEGHIYYDKNISSLPNPLSSNRFLLYDDNDYYNRSVKIISMYDNGHTDNDKLYRELVAQKDEHVFICPVNRDVSQIHPTWIYY